MKGLHLCVPLNRKETTFEHTKRFSRVVAEVLQRNYPNLVTAKMSKEHRKRRVFINWSQNDSAKTMVCVYSLRAGQEPTVSFPLAWSELEKAVRLGDAGKLRVIHSAAVSRLDKKGDLFRDLIVKKQKLPYV
jgi:bifunctional non-homologous end joining protein LigD